MNDIHPTAVIEGDVRLGSGNVIGPFVVVRGPVTIGDDNWLGAGVVVGAPPEVRSFEHPGLSSESAGGGVVIGSRTVIREAAQVHQGWKGVTTVGDDAFVMNQSYVAHDCVLEDGVTLASSVLLAGHVHVGAGANLGLGTTVHQTRSIGRGAMVGMGSVVTRDLPPFSKSWGSPARVASANVVGMRRAGHEEAVVTALARAYEDGRTSPADLKELGLAPLLEP